MTELNDINESHKYNIQKKKPDAKSTYNDSIYIIYIKYRNREIPYGVNVQDSGCYPCNGHKGVSGSDTIVFLLALPDGYTNVALEEIH